MSKKQQDFAIMKAPTPLIIRALGVTVLSDILFLIVAFLIVEIRNVLGVDATMAGLIVLVFMMKTLIVVFGLLTVLNEWLKTTYYVSGGQLVVYRSGMAKSSTVVSLSELRTVKFSQSSIGSQFKYGNVELTFSEGLHTEEITLRDVLQPEKVAAQLKNK